VVPEILEPSLQLAAAVLGTLEFQQDEVSRMIDDFRRHNTRELQDLAQMSKASIGYGERHTMSPSTLGGNARHRSCKHRSCKHRSCVPHCLTHGSIRFDLDG